MLKALKYRLYPTKEQEKTLVEWQGQLRFVWNSFLKSNIDRYNKEKKFNFKFDMTNMLPDLKKNNIWMNAPRQSFQQVVLQLDTALKNCYKFKFGFPKFKSKNKQPQGIKIPQTGTHIKIGPKFIKIPKLGEIKWIKHRNLVGTLKSVTITKDVDQWYISCLCESNICSELKEVKSVENDITAIDLGIKVFLMDSNGVIIESPKYLKKSENKLKRYQRQYSNKKKGSKNLNKAKLKLAKLHRKVRFQRKDFLHKLSNQIANENSIVICEDLAVQNMTHNHKLAKAISDQGWSQFISYLEYKMNWTGGSLIKIDRFSPSSKLCSCCGNKQKISLAERTYTCSSCGLILDRDYNATLNIKAFGLKMLAITNTEGTSEIDACGDTSIEEIGSPTSRFVSKKQEKLTRELHVF